MAIVKANYKPRARIGRIGRSVTYYTWREGPKGYPEHPASWRAANGRALDYDTVWHEVTDEAHESPYTYRILLSTRDVALADDDYAQVLDRHFGDWYFTTHFDGAHPHAHAIAFSDHRLNVQELRAMREELAERELVRERELDRDQELAREW